MMKTPSQHVHNPAFLVHDLVDRFVDSPFLCITGMFWTIYQQPMNRLFLQQKKTTYRNFHSL